MQTRECQVHETSDGVQHVSVFEAGRTGAVESYMVHPCNDILLPRELTPEGAALLAALPVVEFPPKRK